MPSLPEIEQINVFGIDKYRIKGTKEFHLTYGIADRARSKLIKIDMVDNKRVNHEQ